MTVNFRTLKIGVILFTIFSIIFIYGFIAGTYEIFPYDQIRDTKRMVSPQKLCGFHPEDYPQVYQTNVTSLIQIYSPDDVMEKRQDIIDYIWKGNTNSIPIKVEKDIDDSRFDMNNLKQIDKITIEMDYGVNSVAYLFFPKSSENSLVIYHQGHKGDFIHGKNTIEKLVEEGYAVLAFTMPLVEPNSQPIVDMPKHGVFKMQHHNHFLYLDNPDFSSLKFFLEPIMMSLDYVDENYSFEEYSMVGLSGGGWTTTVYSAIDPRIKHSYAVSGGYPEYLQQMFNVGHYERNNSGFMDIVNYPELYVMSSFGENRTSMHISIEWDSGNRCGNFAQTYDEPVKEAVNQLGSGTFKNYLDSSFIGHDISDEAISVILKELNLD